MPDFKPYPCLFPTRILQHRAMAFLPPRERLVITLRYGISDGRSRTLLEVGKELGVTRERVRQLEAAAFKRMRPHIGL